MRKLVGLIIAAVVLSGVAFAQADYPAVRVTEMVQDSVVSIDANTVAFSSVVGGGLGEFSRAQRLLTRRITGFVFSPKGYIVTDARGIQNATILTVHMADGTELDAQVVGYDEDYGIGVIKVKSDKPLKPVKMLDKRYDPLKEIYPYEQGDAVVAIGNSGGLGSTVTFGIISAIRNFRNRSYILLPSVIQADVAINTGNEGCPLFNDRGEVIAMHDRRGGGGSMQNTTFFIPIWLVKRVASELITNFELPTPAKDFKVWHPWLGVKTFSGTRSALGGGVREVGDDLKMYMDIPDQYWDVGIFVDQVWLDSPAAEYGMADKDMLVSLTVMDKNEKIKQPYMLLKSIQDLELLVATSDKGDIFQFGIVRNHALLTIDVVIGQHPGSFSFFSIGSLNRENSREYF